MTATSPDTSSRPLYSNIGEALGTYYFLLKGQLSAQERDYLERTRRLVHEDVLPVINGFWERAEVLPVGFRRCAGQVRARRVARYPRLIWFVDDLPECATGKVQRRDIAIPTADNC